MISNGKPYRGTGGSPLDITYPRASRQTEEQGTIHSYRQRKPPPVADDEMLDDGWTVEKPHTSSTRYDQDYPSLSPRSRKQDKRNPKRTQLVRPRRPLAGKLLIILGLGLMVLVLGVLALNALGNWWQRHSDDVTYGFPRTYQTDQYVGHGDSPAQPDHFIVLNLQGIVEVIEINPHNDKLDRGYYITTTSDPLSPVTLSFPTVGGKQYLYVTIGDPNAAYTVALLNNGQAFVGLPH